MSTLNTQNADACRKANVLGSRRTFTLSHFGECTLPGIVEFFLSSEAIRDDVNATADWMGDKVASNVLSLWNGIIRAWTASSSPSPTGKAQRHRAIEFFGIKNARLVVPDSRENLALHEFEQRLVDAGCHVGLAPNLSYGLASVVHELIDNVFQHSDGDARSQFRGIAAYHVSHEQVTFVVADLGIGTLESLKLSHQWRHLQCDQDALRAIITKHASRKTGLDDGEGYKTVLKKLATTGTSIRIRSGGTGVRICPQKGDIQTEWFQSPKMRGVQVSISCASRGDPKEKVISFDSITGMGD